jgi:hypothetical protein
VKKPALNQARRRGELCALQREREESMMRFETIAKPQRRNAALLATALALAALLLSTRRAAAEESSEELAKKTQNPVADLISVPFQSNFNFNTGPRDKTVYVLNVQPVIPIHLTEDWNLITRIIMPIINQPSLAPGLENASGLGDINPTFFLSPAKSEHLIWGVGPTFTVPTASNHNLGAGKWSMGPSAVGLLMEGPWVVGALGNNQWSYAGWGDKTVNMLLVQPFLNYNFKAGWYLTSAPIITSNWTAKASQQWTAPVGAGFGKLWRVGSVGLPVNTQLQGFYNAIRPDLTSEWQLRVQVQFLFPK